MRITTIERQIDASIHSSSERDSIFRWDWIQVVHLINNIMYIMYTNANNFWRRKIYRRFCKLLLALPRSVIDTNTHTYTHTSQLKYHHINTTTIRNKRIIRISTLVCELAFCIFSIIYRYSWTQNYIHLDSATITRWKWKKKKIWSHMWKDNDHKSANSQKSHKTVAFMENMAWTIPLWIQWWVKPLIFFHFYFYRFHSFSHQMRMTSQELYKN